MECPICKKVLRVSCLYRYARFLAACLLALIISDPAKAQCVDDFLNAQEVSLLRYQHETYVLFKAGNYSQALANVEWLIQQWRGLLSYGGQCGREVREYYEEAVQLKSHVLMTEKRFNVAVVSLREVATTCQACTRNEHAEHFSNLGFVLFQSKRFSESLDAYRSSLELNPDLADATYGAADALLALKRPREAVQYYQRTIQIAGSSEIDQQYAQLARKMIAQINADEAGKSERSKTLPDDLITAPDKQRQPRSAGSGFYVTADQILTNAHVVAGCRRVTLVNFFDQFERASGDRAPGAPLSVVRVNKKLDLALLRATQDQGPRDVARFRMGEEPQPGESVIAFGFPLPGILSSQGNVSVGILSALNGIGDDPYEYQISAPVQPGNSGGPLLDSGGHIIGVVVAKLDAVKIAKVTGDIPQGVNFAVKGSEAVAFLKGTGIAFASEPTIKPLQPTEVAALARGFTVQIECW